MACDWSPGSGSVTVSAHPVDGQAVIEPPILWAHMMKSTRLCLNRRAGTLRKARFLQSSDLLTYPNFSIAQVAWLGPALRTEFLATNSSCQ